MNIYYVIMEVMTLLTEETVCGFNFSTCTEQYVRLHFQLRSCIGDLPEQKYVLGVKETNLTSHPFPRCYVIACNLKLNVNSILRTQKT